jgi:hypothetical protein
MLPALRSRPRLVRATPARVALLVPALFLAIALVFGTSAAPATTADLPLVIKEINNIGGGVPVVAFAGSYAYVGEGGGLSILDISNPEHFVRLAYLRLADPGPTFTPSAIQVIDNHVYISGKNSGGLAIVDVSDHTHPALLGHYTNADIKHSAAASGRVYFFENEQSLPLGPRLRALDVSDPAHPTLLWTWQMNPFSESIDLFAEDGRVYIADTRDGLHILDVQSASGPTLLGTYTTANIRSIAVAGDRAYLAMSEAGIQIIDIQDPAHPTLLGSYDSPTTTYSATQVRTEGGRVYVAATYDGFTGVQVFDMNDPANPTLLGSLNGVQGVGTLQALDGWVSVLSASAWQLIDWRVAATPTPHGRYPIMAYPADIQIEAGRAYIASEYGGGLQILDISDPNSLMQLGSYDSIYATSLEVRDNLAYVTDPVTNGGLRIIDVSNITNPVQIGRYNNTTRYLDVQLVGDLAYVAADGAGLLLIDISNPSNPTQRGSSTAPGNTTAYLQVEGQVAYALDNRYLSGSSTNVLYAIDVSNPAHPTIVGSYQDAVGMNVAKGMDVVDDVAYIPTGESLQMIDISDPAHLTKLGSYAVPSWSVRVIGTRAYISTSSGLDIVDVSDPALPVLLGSYTGPVANARHIEVVGDLVYIAAEWNGIYILRVVDPTTTPTPTPTEEPAEEPQLTINYPTGRPGSAFTIYGSHFRPDRYLDVNVNGALVGTLTTDSAGAFTLILETSPAATPGIYAVSVTKTQPAATGTSEVSYTLAADAPLREHESPPGGVDLAVPADVQPLPAYGIYLPLVQD